ncbi:ABC transporter ATP-binding protein [Halopiger goleimassiliensis]|uniref:ABC transporter ATP-binding protein n=1 Tax=Halopiger goleimassiliensis TaxID=1293048 RepID=UPI000677C585|nr:ABC transporter ATP-binding protein [Halopiger goleimassiliensis]
MNESNAEENVTADRVDAESAEIDVERTDARDEPDTERDVILEVRDLRKVFDGVVAVDGASFDLERGRITGLIGPNGAGKTTTFNLISGFFDPDGGEILFEGRDLREIMRPSSAENRIWVGAVGATGGALTFGAAATVGASSPELAGATAAGTAAGGVLGAGAYYGQEWIRRNYLDYRPNRPFQVSRAGISRTFQITRELQGMTVMENMLLGPHGQRGESLLNAWFRPRAVGEEEIQIQERAGELLELLQLDHLADEYAGNLSGGQRKLLELGRVLMTDPDLILLDEPVAGVNPTLQETLLERIQALRNEGYTFCIVEHDMDVIMRISDRVIVMDQGSVLVEGPPEIVRTDERVIDAYLGG